MAFAAPLCNCVGGSIKLLNLRDLSSSLLFPWCPGFLMLLQHIGAKLLCCYLGPCHCQVLYLSKPVSLVYGLSPALHSPSHPIHLYPHTQHSWMGERASGAPALDTDSERVSVWSSPLRSFLHGRCSSMLSSHRDWVCADRTPHNKSGGQRLEWRPSWEALPWEA